MSDLTGQQGQTTRPHRPKKRRSHPWNGKEYALVALARMHGRTANCVNYRMNDKGMTLEEALAQPLKRRSSKGVMACVENRLDGEISPVGEIPKRFYWQGKSMTIREMVEVAPVKITIKALRARLTSGWKLERAMTEPVKARTNAVSVSKLL